MYAGHDRGTTDRSRIRFLLRWNRAAIVVLLIATACSGDGSEDSGGGIGGGIDANTDPLVTSTLPDVEPAEPGATLARVQARGRLRCGVGDRRGFATQNGAMSEGFDVDFCRVIAAVTLGDATKVDFVDVSAPPADALARLHDDDPVDVIFRVLTHTAARDALGYEFGPTIFHDGQKFMGEAASFSSRTEFADLDGASVCVGNNTSLRNLRADSSGIDLDLEPFPTATSAIEAFANDECQLVSADESQLFAERQAGWVIFPPDPISREPLAPAFLQGDPQWADIVRWSVHATVIAELHGVTKDDVREKAADPLLAPDMRRLLGVAGRDELLSFQVPLGVRSDAFLLAIVQVGNYGEIYDDHLTDLGMTRAGSLNALAIEGGLITAPVS